MDLIFKKFKAALCGIWMAFSDKSVFVQFVIAICVILFGMAYGFSLQEWMWIGSCIVLVVICEIFNTAIERVCDLIDENYNEKIKFIKDISAAAVLLAALYACFIGGLILKGVLR